MSDSIPKAKDTANKARDTAGTAWSGLQNEARDKINQAKDTWSGVQNEAKAKVNQAKDQWSGVKDDARDKANEARDTAGNLWSGLQDDAFPKAKVPQLIAVGIIGLQAGALTFVSLTTCRTFHKLLKHPEKLPGKNTTNEVNREGVDVIRKFFPVWWPIGRDLMAPLAVAGSATSIIAYFMSGSSDPILPSRKRDPLWLLTAALSGILLPYTGFVMQSDIGALRQALTDGEEKEVAKRVESFTAKHHVRTLLVGSAFVIGLVALVTRKPKA
jgi:hypothetical protein